MNIDKYIKKIDTNGMESLRMALETCPMYVKPVSYLKDLGHLAEDDFRNDAASMAAERLLYFWVDMGGDGTTPDLIATDLSIMADIFRRWATAYQKKARKINGVSSGA